MTQTRQKRQPKGTSSTPEQSELDLIAYRMHRPAGLRIVRAPVSRAWIDATNQQFAKRCLPLLIANQAGWFVLNSHTFTARWNGGDDQDAVTLTFLSGEPPYPALSHVGSGIIPWHLPYLFRTPPGWQLLARGPANWPKDGVTALEGLVETDWAVATFTMNWQMTRPGLTVTFEAGEPICMVVPTRTADLEAFQPAIRNLGDDPDLRQQHEAWSVSRGQFLADLKIPESESVRQGWQRHYFKGTAPDGLKAQEHRTQLRLREFDDPDAICVAVEPSSNGSPR